jgi:hypothetical protein
MMNRMGAEEIDDNCEINLDFEVDQDQDQD